MADLRDLKFMDEDTLCMIELMCSDWRSAWELTSAIEKAFRTNRARMETLKSRAAEFSRATEPRADELNECLDDYLNGISDAELATLTAEEAQLKARGDLANLDAEREAEREEAQEKLKWWRRDLSPAI